MWHLQVFANGCYIIDFIVTDGHYKGRLYRKKVFVFFPALGSHQLYLEKLSWDLQHERGQLIPGHLLWQLRQVERLAQEVSHF